MELFEEGLGPIPPIEGHEGKQGELRRDLEFLREYLGEETLIKGLASHNIHRAVEIGVGIGTREELVAILQLAALTHRHSSYFTSTDLWAIDPDFFLISSLKDDAKISPWLNRFEASSISANMLVESIKRGEQRPFDMVISKGVVSVGGADYTLGKKEVIDFSEAREFALGVIPAMRDCLSSSPQALLMMCTKCGDTYLPFTEQDLSTLGLKIVKHKPPEDSDISKVDRLILRAGGHFPDDFVFYNTVICQRSSL